MATRVVGSEVHTVASLVNRPEGTSMSFELVPPLFSPQLVAVGEVAFLLRGFESIDGAAHVQEWHCVLKAS